LLWYDIIGNGLSRWRNGYLVYDEFDGLCVLINDPVKHKPI
jgi:hypothetical protein